MMVFVVLLCKGGKIIFPLPFMVLSRDPHKKKKWINESKANRSLLTCMPVYVWEIPKEKNE
jgi:hypothetical protein